MFDAEYEAWLDELRAIRPMTAEEWTAWEREHPGVLEEVGAVEIDEEEGGEEA